nr:uncharacterized protein LOC120973669 [Aegilops tauschii subsp. strangulata]
MSHVRRNARTRSPPPTKSTRSPPSTTSPSSTSVTRPDEDTLVAATPDVALELAVLSSVSFSTNKVHEVIVVPRSASPVYIGMAPSTCSTKCSNQVGATSFPSPVTTASLLPAATRELVADLVCPATKAVNSMQPFRKHDLDVSPHTSHQGRLLLRPMPWPSLRATRIAEGMETRPILWPSFAIGMPSEVCHSSVAHWNFSVTTSVHGLHAWTFREHPFQFAQVLDMALTSSSFPMESCHVGDLVGNHRGHRIQKNFSSDLNMMRESWWCLQIAQQKTFLLEKAICWIPLVPRSLPTPSQQLMQQKDTVNFTDAERVPVISSLQSYYEFHAQARETSCTRRFFVSTELQSYHGTKLRPKPSPLFDFNQDTTQLKIKMDIFFMQLPNSTRGVQALNVWSALSKGNEHANALAIFEPSAIEELAILTSFQCCFFKRTPDWILLIRPPTEKRTSEDKNPLVWALFTDA